MWSSGSVRPDGSPGTVLYRRTSRWFLARIDLIPRLASSARRSARSRVRLVASASVRTGQAGSGVVAAVGLGIVIAPASLGCVRVRLQGESRNNAENLSESFSLFLE